MQRGVTSLTWLNTPRLTFIEFLGETTAMSAKTKLRNAQKQRMNDEHAALTLIILCN